jgi:mono/diheme cytochrome c family protein
MQISLFWKIVLASASLLLLLGNVFVICKNYDSEWRDYQTEYLNMAADRTDDPQMKAIIKARSPKIDQLIINRWGQQRIDRCPTCHAGFDDPNFSDAPLPFRTHPDIPGNHSYRAIGCTVCHDGNGRGLSAEDAHGEHKHWKKPRLTGDNVEAGCAKCHPAPYLKETPLLRMGARLFMTKACYGCHKVEGVSAGKLGPELTDVGNKWSFDYLRESIVDPLASNLESNMPRLELSGTELKALIIYLKSLTGENLVGGPVGHFADLKSWRSRKPEKVEISAASGKKVFEKRACNACHMINGTGGTIGPELSVYGLQRTKEWMIAHHIDPRSLVAGSIMPDLEYSESELEALGLYLESLKKLDVDNAEIFAPEGTR